MFFGWGMKASSLLHFNSIRMACFVGALIDFLRALDPAKVVFSQGKAFHIIYIDAWDIQFIISLSNETINVCCMFKVVSILSNQVGNNYIQSNV